MTSSSFGFRLEHPDDCDAIDHLHGVSFGPGRFARAAFRVREGVVHDLDLSMVAVTEARLVGSIRLTPILIGATPALLLGPLAVLPEFKGKGAGRGLLARSVEQARARGNDFVLLVGDAPYYGPFGFRPVPSGSITFPAPVDPARILLNDLRVPSGVPPRGDVAAMTRDCAAMRRCRTPR